MSTPIQFTDEISQSFGIMKTLSGTALDLLALYPGLLPCVEKEEGGGRTPQFRRLLAHPRETLQMVAWVSCCFGILVHWCLSPISTPSYPPISGFPDSSPVALALELQV